MSVSTVSQPGYNKFYDEQSISSGGSVDTFVNKKGRRHGSATAGRPLGSGAEQGLFSSLLAPFYNCCSPKFPAAPGAGSDSPTGGGSKSGEGYTESDLDTDGETDVQSSSGGTYDAYAIGAAPHVRDKNKINQLPDIEKSASWRITPSAKGMKRNVALSPEEKEYTALVFCLRMERSSHMNEKLILSVIKEGANQQSSVLVSLKKPEFSLLSLVRVIEARTVQEILGDLLTAMEHIKQQDNNGAVYAIISKIRCLAVCARQQGEAMMLAAFDPSPTDKRGPAIFGFKKITDMENFITALYGSDPEVKRAPSEMRYKSYLMASSTSYQAVQSAANRPWALPPTSGKDSVQDELKLEEKRLADPKYDAKRVHGIVDAVAAKPTAQDKQVFTYDPATGLRITDSDSSDSSSDE